VSASLLKHALQSHPANAAPPGLRGEVQRLAPDDPLRPLRLRFELHGDLAGVRLPAPLEPGAPRRADGLWKHTCFEAFVAAPPAPGSPAQTAGAIEGSDSVAYVEFNLAPSGAWAIYRFDGYRAGMRAEPAGIEPRIVAVCHPGTLRVEVALAWPAPLPASAARPNAARDAATVTAEAATPWRGRLGMSAVVEAADGSLSYWALHHPAARADFHNDGGFILGLEVPA